MIRHGSSAQFSLMWGIGEGCALFSRYPMRAAENRPTIESYKANPPSGILDFRSTSRGSFLPDPEAKPLGEFRCPLCSFSYSPLAVRPTPPSSDTIMRIGPPGFAANHSFFFTSGPMSSLVILRRFSIGGRRFSARRNLCLPDRLLPMCPPGLGASVARVLRRLRGGVRSGME